MATTYTVKPGDTLSQIAQTYGVDMGGITGYKSGDLNKIGAGEVLNINAPTLPPANTINAPDLNTQPYKVMPPAPVTAYDGLIKSSEAAITTLASDTKTGMEDIKNKYTRLGQLPTEQADAYKKEGVYDKRGVYTNAVNTINQKELAYQTRIDKIRNNNPTGALQEGQQIEMDRITKDWAIEKAALSISAAFLKDDYELAKSIVDDRISAETDSLKNELAGLEFFYSQNYNQLSDEKKQLLEFQMKNIQDEKDAKENTLREIGALQLAAAENGAPSSVVVGIGKATDLTQAISAAGSWIDQTIDRKGTGTGSSTVDLAPEDERLLTGAGFSTQDIGDLPRAVAAYGVDAVINALDTPAKKAAVRKVYGIQEYKTRANVESEVDQIGVDLIINTLFEDDQKALEQLAKESGFASWWKPSSSEVKKFLKSDVARTYAIDQYIEKYRQEGKYSE